MNYDRRSSTLQRAYNDESTDYDAIRYESAEGQYFCEYEVSILVDLLRPTAAMTILDVPAGTGRLSIPLAKTGATIVAVDISPGMLQQAQSKAAGQGVDNIIFKEASATDLPFEDNSMDAVLSFKFFHLIPLELKHAAVAEMRRVLIPGGLLIVEFNSPFYGVLMAAYRYYFRTKNRGNMRKKCLFPDQVGKLFQGMEVNAQIGVKLPFSGACARFLGKGIMDRINRFAGRIPVIRQLCYVIIIVARKHA